MPKALLDRCQPDSIREFRLAAAQRFSDGVSLARDDRRTAAIYIWGYAAEMMVKAGYFDAIGFSERQRISLTDLRAAVASAQAIGLTWQGNLHSIKSWADLLVDARASNPTVRYQSPAFGNEVRRRSRSISVVWSEILRYHKNDAYEHEVERVRQATRWLLDHGAEL